MFAAPYKLVELVNQEIFMTTSLKRVELGNVGDQPGHILMQTTNTFDEVQVAGFINSVESYSSVTVTPTDMVYATLADFQEAIFQPSFGANGVITLIPLTGGGSGTITHGISLGGDAIYAGAAGSALLFKGITAGTNVTLTPGADSIEISASGGGGSGTVTSVATNNGITGGTITTTGTIGLANIDPGMVLSNITNAPATPVPNSMSEIFDDVFGNTQGGIIYRDASAWVFLGTGTNGQFLTSGGPAANLSWTTGGAAGFAYEQAYWVSQANGNDANAGTSIDTPLQTVQAAVNLIVSGAPVIIYVVDANGSNNETITTPGLGYTIIISAPGTLFQGSIIQSVNDEVIVEAIYVDSFVSNSASNTFLYGGNMIVTTTSSGTVNARLSQYNGFHTGGGSLIIVTNYLSGLTTDNTITAYVSAPLAQNINNGGSLDILTGTPPGVCLASNTGSITGFLGGVAFGDLGIAQNSGSTVANYSFTSASPTGAAQVLISSGAGPGATTSWATQGGYTPFAYEQAFWVSQLNGNDSNLGTSIETPFLTLQHAVTTASNTATVIYLVDSANNNEGVVTAGIGQNLYIMAPGTNISQASFTISATDTVYMDCPIAQGTITNNGLFYGNIKTLSGGLTANSGTTYLYTQYMGTYVGDAGSLAYINCENANTFNVTGGELNLTITGNNGGLDLNSSPTVNLLCTFPISIVGDGTATVNGYAGNTIYGGGAGPTVASTNGTALYTLPPASPTTGQVIVATSSSASAWGSSAGIQSSIYVSQAFGNDTTGDGTFGNPYATLTKGFSEISGSLLGVTVLDSADYFESTISITDAQFLYSPSGSITTSFIAAANFGFTVTAPNFSGSSSVVLDDGGFNGTYVLNISNAFSGSISLSSGTSSVVGYVGKLSGGGTTYSLGGDSIYLTTSELFSSPTKSGSGVASIQSMTGSFTTDNIVTFDDTFGTIKDSGVPVSSLSTSHAYTQALWVDDANGNDSNTGTSIDSPFLTYTKAFTIASTTPTIIYGMNGNGANTEAITTLTTGQKVFLQAPGTVFAGTFTIAGSDIIDAVSDQFSNVQLSGTATLYGTVDAMTLTISGTASANIAATGPLMITASGTTAVTASSDNGVSTYSQSGSNAVAYLEGNWSSVTASYRVYFSGSGIGTLAVNSGAQMYISCGNVAVLNNSGTLLGNIGECGSFTNSGDIYGNIAQFTSSFVPSLYGPYQLDGRAFVTATIDATANFTNLGSAAQVPVIIAASANAAYKVANIYLNSNGTNFAGALANRNLALTDGSTVYTVIPAATLQALSTLNAGWGSVSVPFPASAAISTITGTGANLYLQYSGGTTDYTSGSVKITVEFARVK